MNIKEIKTKKFTIRYRYFKNVDGIMEVIQYLRTREFIKIYRRLIGFLDNY